MPIYYAVLGFVVVVMVVMMMVMRSRGKGRSCEHEDQEHSSKDLLHEVNLARCRLWKYLRRAHESSEETADPNMR
jgi:5-bromo-4-chloroindolyl phosphate hydrolysis protein